jgi:hypothetical protein
MESVRKREMLQAFKEAKVAKGVFAVRCTTTGQTWVATSKNLGQQRNSVWFMLKHGNHPNRAVQSAWDEHGEGAFAFEVLDEVDDEGLTPLGLSDLLKHKAGEWRDALGAQKLAG